jgi:hypothetical protein
MGDQIIDLQRFVHVSVARFGVMQDAYNPAIQLSEEQSHLEVAGR